MYISPDPQINHGTYFNLVRDIVTAVPSAWPIIEGINNDILNGDLYQALKEARKLIAYEKKLLDQNEAPANTAASADRARCLTQRLIARGVRTASISSTPSATLIRDARVRAEFQHRRHQRIDVAHVGAMVDDRRADREPAVERGRRRRRDSGLLDVDATISRLTLSASSAR